MVLLTDNEIKQTQIDSKNTATFLATGQTLLPQVERTPYAQVNVIEEPKKIEVFNPNDNQSPEDKLWSQIANVIGEATTVDGKPYELNTLGEAFTGLLRFGKGAGFDAPMEIGQAIGSAIDYITGTNIAEGIDSIQESLDTALPVEGTVGRFAEPIGQAVGSAAVGTTALKGLGLSNKLATLGGVPLGEMLGFDPEDENAADVAKQMFGLDNAVIDLFAKDVDDTEVEARLKNALTGVVADAAMSPVIKALGGGIKAIKEGLYTRGSTQLAKRASDQSGRIKIPSKTTANTPVEVVNEVSETSLEDTLYKIATTGDTTITGKELESILSGNVSMYKNGGVSATDELIKSKLLDLTPEQQMLAKDTYLNTNLNKLDMLRNEITEDNYQEVSKNIYNTLNNIRKIDKLVNVEGTNLSVIKQRQLLSAMDTFGTDFFKINVPKSAKDLKKTLSTIKKGNRGFFAGATGIGGELVKQETRVFMNSILGNLSTHAGNIASNIGNVVASPIDKYWASGVGSVMKKVGNYKDSELIKIEDANIYSKALVDNLKQFRKHWDEGWSAFFKNPKNNDTVKFKEVGELSETEIRDNFLTEIEMNEALTLLAPKTSDNISVQTRNFIEFAEKIRNGGAKKIIKGTLKAADVVGTVGSGADVSYRALAGTDEFFKSYVKASEAQAYALIKSKELANVDIEDLTRGDMFEFKNVPSNKDYRELFETKRKAYLDVLSGNEVSEKVISKGKQEAIKAEMLDHVNNYASRMTFQEDMDGLFGSIVKSVGKLKAVRILSPFLKTPFNIAKEIVYRSPIGGAYNTARYATRNSDNAVLSKFSNNISAKEFQLEMGKAISGTLTGLTIYSMFVDNDNITGSGPSNYHDYKIWAQTHQPHSIKLGNKWFEYKNMGTIGMILKQTSELNEALINARNSEEGELFVESYIKSLTNLLKGEWNNNPTIGAIDTIMDMMDDQKGGKSSSATLQRTLSNRFTSGFPVVKSLARALNGSMKDYYDESAITKWKVNTLPGYADKWAEPKLDIFGNEQDTNSLNSISPFKFKTSKQSTALGILEALNYPFAMARKEINGKEIDTATYNKMIKYVASDEYFGQTLEDAIVQEYNDAMYENSHLSNEEQLENAKTALRGLYNSRVKEIKTAIIEGSI